MRQKVIVIAGKDPELALSGTETYMKAFGRAAIRAGFEPHFFAVSDRTSTVETEYGSVHCICSPIRPYRGLMVRLHAPFLVAGIDRFLREIGPPYLVHSFGSWSGVGATLAKRLARKGRTVHLATPWTTYYHETQGKVLGLGKHYSPLVRLSTRLELWWTALTVAPMERRGLHAADEVLVNYESVRRIVEEECGKGIRFGRMKYASESAFIRSQDEPPSPLPDAVAELRPSDAPLIVSVSRHDARKGLPVLLSALADLRDQGIPYRACLAGSGPLEGEHRRLVGALSLEAKVVIPGYVEDVFGLLRHADIFVLPSLEEASGSISLLEAMQARVAPVVSRLDGLPEDVDHEASALLVEPGDRRQLAAALRRCLTDPALRQRLAEGAHARYLRDFSAAGFAADVARIYAAHGFHGEPITTRANG